MASETPTSPTPLAEISHGPSAFEQFLENNQKSVLALAVLIVLGAAGWVVYSGIEKSRQITAGALLSKAEDTASLQAIVSEQSKTHAAGSAKVLLAESQWDGGQQDAAISTLRAFIDSNSKHPALATARASLAAKLMFQGKTADAATLFQQVIDDPFSRHLAPYAMISLGDIAKAAGDTEKAEGFYSRSKTDYPQSRFAQTAGDRIAGLKAKAPVEVEPPPPAPEPAPAQGTTTSAVTPSAPDASADVPVVDLSQGIPTNTTVPADSFPEEKSDQPATDGQAPSNETSPASPEP